MINTTKTIKRIWVDPELAKVKENLVLNFAFLFQVLTQFKKKERLHFTEEPKILITGRFVNLWAETKAIIPDNNPKPKIAITIEIQSHKIWYGWALK